MRAGRWTDAKLGGDKGSFVGRVASIRRVFMVHGAS
jgi:hypothetical protein